MRRSHARRPAAVAVVVALLALLKSCEAAQAPQDSAYMVTEAEIDADADADAVAVSDADAQSADVMVEDNESGTKFMLDQTAVKFVRARLRAATIADWVTSYYSWSQESYRGSDRARFMRCARIYVQIIEKLEVADPMSELRRAIKSVEGKMSSQRTSGRQGGGSIPLGTQSQEFSDGRSREVQQQEAADKLAVLRQFESHLYSEGATQPTRHVVNGKTISVLDRHAASYMEQRLTAHLARRQAQAITSLMSPGLPKIWASRYAEVMGVLEARGIDAIDTIAEIWGAQAEHLSDDLEKREKRTGRSEFAYGGKADPDGRNLVLTAFRSVPEWGKYVKKPHKIGESTRKDSGSKNADVVYGGNFRTDAVPKPLLPQVSGWLLKLLDHLSPTSSVSWWRLANLRAKPVAAQVGIFLTLAVCCLCFSLLVTYVVSAMVEQWIGGGENVQLAVTGTVFILIALICCMPQQY